MNKQQTLVIASAVALFFVLYFGCDTKSKEQKLLTQSRALTLESLDINTHISATFDKLTAEQKAIIQPLTQKAESKDPSVLKPLSAAWHNAGHDEIAANYAEQVANIEKTEAAWSIAGANYYLAIQQSQEDNIRNFATQHAVSAFQNATSLNPANIENKINLALCYTENPPQDNPMKGTLLLLDLERNNSGNVPVNIQLARLGIKTGQFDKAIGRLEKILTKEPNNKRAVCLLAEAYNRANNPKATEMAKKCETVQ
jgi:tetratricopeptide (TPR) repeat protein